MRLRLDCKDLPALLSQRLDATASPGSRLRVRLHLCVCRSCRAVNAQLVFIRRAMRRLDQQQGHADPPGLASAPAGTSAADRP